MSASERDREVRHVGGQVARPPVEVAGRQEQCLHRGHQRRVHQSRQQARAERRQPHRLDGVLSDRREAGIRRARARVLARLGAQRDRARGRHALRRRLRVVAGQREAPSGGEASTPSSRASDPPHALQKRAGSSTAVPQGRADGLGRRAGHGPAALPAEQVAPCGTRPGRTGTAGAARTDAAPPWRPRPPGSGRRGRAGAPSRSPPGRRRAGCARSPGRRSPASRSRSCSRGCSTGCPGTRSPRGAARPWRRAALRRSTGRVRWRRACGAGRTRDGRMTWG